MRPLLAIFKLVGIVILLFSTINCNNQSQKAPREYDYHLSTELMKVQRELYGLLEIMGTKNKGAINQQLQATQKVIDLSIQKVTSIPTLSNDSGYKDITLQHLKVNKRSLAHFYPEIIRLSLIPTPTLEESDKLEILFDQLEDIEEPIDESLINTRKIFCKKYHIEYLGLKND